MGAYYRSTVEEFLRADPRVVLGELTQAQTGTTPEQRRSWEQELSLLRAALSAVRTSILGSGGWGLLLEYQMYRLQRRLDAVLLASDLILVIEFKMGAEQYDASGVAQAEDYALDLRDFHEASQHRRLVPILCSSDAPKLPADPLDFVDGVSNTLRANTNSLADLVCEAFDQGHRPTAEPIDLYEWDRAPYRPVPSIIEAAEMLYSAHSVEDIHAALADEKNLTATTDRLIEIIEDVESREVHAICFVTGVPGSGKTLTGLNAVHDPRFRGADRTSGAFLSGNTPLVEVLREALARDHKRNEGGTLSAARRKTKAEIQLLMNFLKEYLEQSPDRPPHEHVIVFDEAQRAWDADYGKKKFGREASEPALFLEIMNRHTDWCLIIGLVGGGQEINRGEGGLEEWGVALAAFDPEGASGKTWEIHASPHVVEGTDVTAGSSLFPEGLPDGFVLERDARLHLPVSIRSHRCEVAAAWVNAVLDGQPDLAADLSSSIDDFPIYLTRSIDEAKDWLQRTTRGNRRCGLVASSAARRLRAYGLGVSVGANELDAVRHWYLAPSEDVRSSFALEVTANEYTCQGLELDRVGLCWGGDMTWRDGSASWLYQSFSGTRWVQTSREERIENTKNTYRVLLTRAREAMVIWVPPGDPSDRTRDPERMEQTAGYLRRCGVRDLAPLSNAH